MANVKKLIFWEIYILRNYFKMYDYYCFKAKKIKGFESYAVDPGEGSL